MIALTLFSVILGVDLVSADGNVISASVFAHGTQVDFPWRVSARVLKSASHELKSPSGNVVLSVQCEEYDKENPRVMIYTHDWALVDHAVLSPTDDSPCDSVQNYIIPQDRTEEEAKHSRDDYRKFSITFVWSGKVSACVRRSYAVFFTSVMASVTRDGFPTVDCPTSASQYIKKYPDLQNVGGVLTLSHLRELHTYEYNQNVKTQGTPVPKPFPSEDFEHKKFSLICREDESIENDPHTGNKVITGSIVHEDNPTIVLEKFKMKICTTEKINVKRRVEYGTEKFKVVYMDVEGQCFERALKILRDESCFFYSHKTITRSERKKITCPKL